MLYHGVTLLNSIKKMKVEKDDIHKNGVIFFISLYSCADFKAQP